jgi:hypothetical protein
MDQEKSKKSVIADEHFQTDSGITRNIRLIKRDSVAYPVSSERKYEANKENYIDSNESSVSIPGEIQYKDPYGTQSQSEESFVQPIDAASSASFAIPGEDLHRKSSKISLARTNALESNKSHRISRTIDGILNDGDEKTNRFGNETRKDSKKAKEMLFIKKLQQKIF